jgi:metalloendopeptidase OMA1, mitochondrial
MDTANLRPPGWRRLALWLGLAGALTAGCNMAPAPPQRRGAGPGGRPQDLGLSPRQELQVGREAYRQVLDEYRGRILPKDSPEYKRVDHVAHRIEQAAQIRPLQKEINLRIEGYRFEWEVNVVREKQVNAACLPGGKIIVFTGLLEFVGNDDSQLAAVLAHEVAHALAHHGSERLARQRYSTGILRSRSFDRAQESEADHIGIFLMTFAGYNPQGAIRFWDRMSRLGRSRMPEFFSDHPSPERRLRDAQRWAKDAVRAKRAYDEGRVVRE